MAGLVDAEDARPTVGDGDTGDAGVARFEEQQAGESEHAGEVDVDHTAMADHPDALAPVVGGDRCERGAHPVDEGVHVDAERIPSAGSHVGDDVGALVS